MTEIKHAKYFSICVDSGHFSCSQLSFIVRYVSEYGCSVEQFLKFIPNCGHKVEDLAKVILETFKNHDLDVANCRGQSYDNASNMSGVYSGPQVRIKQVNSLMDFVPCSTHSLKLVGSCAAESCQGTVSFFGILQSLYNFFFRHEHTDGKFCCRNSNSRLVKSLSQTKWSARTDACRSLCCSWDEIMAALQIIANDANEKPSTRS
ncbi:zinc finger MYM-type protein 1-like [Stegodyphus dumicola]|uniref:zinc finger MYM-type protein 1-like n=1 Tax=Stegodyphus dumicola TaxID=202533 RepID=UPI0015B27EA1|nr:zinc finger MYM-type protein 1-like [Stegodyphus dumicola]